MPSCSRGNPQVRRASPTPCLHSPVKIDRSHFSWLLFVIVATLATAVLYVANFYPGSLPIPIKFPPVFGDVPPTRHTFGGTPLGLVLGSIAFAIFLFASALGIRK